MTTALMLGLLMAPGSSSAHLLAHNDPDDVRGPMDLRRASLERADRQLVATVRTFERFTKEDMLGNAFFFDFDTRGDNRRDFSLRMDYYEGGSPYCTLYDREGFSRFGTYGEKGRRSFACTFSRSELEATRHIRWRSRSEGSFGVYRAPNRGWYRH